MGHRLCFCPHCVEANKPMPEQQAWADGYTDGLKYGMRRAEMLAQALKGLMDNAAAPAQPEESDAYKAWLWAESALAIWRGDAKR